MSTTATIKIYIDDSFSAERALKKFKRQCDSLGIVKEYRNRQVYKKPSVKSKEKIENAQKRRNKANNPKYAFSSKV